MVEDILKEWGFPFLVATFEENGIDDEAFNVLTFDAIDQLCSGHNMGIKLKFKAKFREYQKKKTPDLSFSASETNSDSESSIRSSLGTPSTAELTSDDDGDEIEKSKYDKAYIEKILKQSSIGRGILRYYYENEVLTNTFRDRIVQLIIENETSSDTDFRISRKQFSDMAKAIVEIFPSEAKEIYFNISIRKTSTNNRIKKLGGGKLFRKFYNFRRELKSTGLLVKSTNPKSLTEYTPTEEDKEIVAWLQSNIEPWPLVEENWNTTYLQRNLILKELNSIHQYMNTFKALKSPLGYSLIEKDFARQYPDNDLLLIRWPKFA